MKRILFLLVSLTLLSSCGNTEVEVTTEEVAVEESTDVTSEEVVDTVVSDTL